MARRSPHEEKELPHEDANDVLPPGSSLGLPKESADRLGDRHDIQPSIEMELGLEEEVWHFDRALQKEKLIGDSLSSNEHDNLWHCLLAGQ